MNSEKKLRKFLQDRFDPETYRFDGSDWDHARKLIDSKRRGRRKRSAALLASFAGLVLILLWSAGPVNRKNDAILSEVTHTAARSEAIPAKLMDDVTGNDASPDKKENRSPEKEAYPASVSLFAPGEENKVNNAARRSMIVRSDAPADEKSEPGIVKIEDEVADDDIQTGVRTPSKLTPVGVSVPAIPIVPAFSEVRFSQAQVCEDPGSAPEVNDPRSPASREGFYLGAGGGWLNGWKTGSMRDARGLTPVAGMGYLSRIDNRSSFSFGIFYSKVVNLGSVGKTSRITSYRFGEESKVTVIMPVTLHYLIAPLRVNYFPGRGHVLGGGVDIGYLLNVDASVSQFEEKAGGTANHTSTVLSGYTEGFSWYDARLSAFYGRDLTGRFGVQIDLFFGLTDVRQDDFFRKPGNERNSGVNLTVLYYLKGK